MTSAAQAPIEERFAAFADLAPEPTELNAPYWEGLAAGCVRIVHTDCAGKVKAQQNMQIIPGRQYRVPPCSGWNCQCL